MCTGTLPDSSWYGENAAASEGRTIFHLKCVPAREANPVHGGGGTSNLHLCLEAKSTTHTRRAVDNRVPPSAMSLSTITLGTIGSPFGKQKRWDSHLVAPRDGIFHSCFQSP